MSNILPKRVNDSLVTLVKNGLISEQQKNNLIAKYLRMRDLKQVRHRRVKTSVPDALDNGIKNFYETNHTFKLNGDNMVKAMMRFTGSIRITPSMIYHRLQKLVDQGILTRVSVEGSKEVLYAKANIPLNNK
tara:strand:+ start:53 stop:448 length:396 start_codon:yes stop_codon:yes gene_type:complete